MNALNCKICYKQFRPVASPRMLPCGHSCCTWCLRQILTATKCCPFCRKDLTILEVAQYPVIYSMLEICKELSDSPYNMANLQKRLQLVHEKHTKILSFAEGFILKVNEHMSEVETMKKNATKLLNFVATDNFSFKEVYKSLELIEQTMNNVAKIFSWKDDSENILDFKIDSSKFDGYDWIKFLAKIPESIAGNKKFAALLMVDGVKKFAKLSTYENYLCIHSLETLEDNHDFTTICGLLKELLTSSSQDSIYSFFDIRFKRGVFPRKVIVEVTDPTYWSSQFLKFCTGELGESYKGHVYTQSFGNKIELADGSDCVEDKFIQTKKLRGFNKCLDIYSIFFSSKDTPETMMPSNSCFLTCTGDGALEIQRFECSCDLEYTNVIGPIVDFHGDFAATFKDATFRTIIDCGIAFKL